MEYTAHQRTGAAWFKVTLLTLLALALAGGWLLFALIAGKGGLQQAVSAGSSREAAAAQAVVRSGLTPVNTTVQVTFATPEYYELTGQQEIGRRYGTDRYLVFVVSEVHHSRVLDVHVPELSLDGRSLGLPDDVRVLNESEHHRTRVLRWEHTMPDSGATLAMTWPDLRPAALAWHLPLDLGSGAAGGPVSPIVFLALTAGLFAALSPCLIQLTLYYVSALASSGAALATAGAAAAPTGAPAVSRRVLAMALWFVAGVVVAYTLGGALAGLAGQYLQENGALGGYTRPLSILAGAVIVALGIYTGAAARAPMLCRLPLPRLTQFARRGGGPGTLAMGFFVALGCLQCFGGAIFASLLLYVGSLGSPAMGALMLFVFSLGVAVPFLAAALAWSRVMPYVHRLHRATPYIALASSAMMILFGALMIADKFHWVSGVLLDLMPFLQV